MGHRILDARYSARQAGSDARSGADGDQPSAMGLHPALGGTLLLSSATTASRHRVASGGPARRLDRTVRRRLDDANGTHSARPSTPVRLGKWMTAPCSTTWHRTSG